MCETQVICKAIGRVGRRSYDRRIKIASAMYVNRNGDMTRLLNDVDRLSAQLHDAFPTITGSDYNFFGQELSIVIDTLKALSRETASHSELTACSERLRRQIDDLEELTHDIKAFRIDAANNKQLQATMASIDGIDFSKYARR